MAVEIISLDEALKNYEHSLSDDEKRRFRAQETPSVLAAIDLTRLINSDSQSPNKQLLNPKHAAGLAVFLQSVQQFCGVVDTFVSSRPDVAALVWGGVKLSLQAIGNAASYLEQLSDLFIRLRNDFPRFQEYEKLYRKSKRVQTALCDYYAVVIQLCQHVTESSRKSVYRRQLFAMLYPYDAEFGNHEKNLRALSKVVGKEIDLALHKRQDASYKTQRAIKQKQDENGEVLVDLRDQVVHGHQNFDGWLVEARQQMLKAERSRVLARLSSYNHQTSYRRIRRECVPGTSTWVCETRAFHNWSTRFSKTLWCIGRLGSGKSFLSACVVHHLETELSHDVASYFFCRYNDQASLEARTIVGSIAKQFAATLSMDVFKSKHDECTDPSAIIDFLKANLSRDRHYFIVLDGLDECEEAEIRIVADSFHSLLRSPLNIKFYCSSRPIQVSWLAGKFKAEERIVLESRTSQVSIAADIDRYIRITIEERRQGSLPRLEVGDQDLMCIILNRLEEGAEGMFLWVNLQIENLCEMRSDAEILSALKDYPRSLSQTYERNLNRFVETKDIELGIQIFNWVAIAKRPLTMEELQEVIATEPLQHTMNSNQLKNNMKRTLECCGNLVHVDEEDRTVHFTHSSVKKYLTSNDIHESVKQYKIDLQKADAEAGVICTTYVNSLVSRGQVARKIQEGRNFAAIPGEMLGDSSRPRKAFKETIFGRSKQSLESNEALNRSISEIFTNTEIRRKQQALSEYHFRAYAEEFWLDHTKQRIDPESSAVLWEMWCGLVEEADISSHLRGVPWTFEDWRERSTDIVIWIVEQNHCSLAQLYLTSSADFALPDLLHLFESAAERGQTVLLGLCLQSGKISGADMHSALLLASQGGHFEIVNMLISANVNVDVRAFYESQTALQAAITCSHADIVDRLLDAGADVNAEALGEGGRTALQAATERGNLELVIRLLKLGAHINAPPTFDNGRTALQAAAERGHNLVVTKLLREKAEVNAAPCDENGRTAFQAAAEQGHLDVMKKLLRADEKVNINAAAGPREGKTALQAAAASGDESVVRLLLELGADINAQASPHHGMTTIQAAAGNGHLAVVQLLLRAKDPANVNDFDYYNNRWTALQRAAGNGHLAVVKSLLKHGAELNARASLTGGRTALQAAAEGGHSRLVDYLLLKGAHVNAPPGFGKGRTALQAAVEGGFADLVDTLLKKGADVSAAGAETDGKTARQAALDSGHLDIVNTLEKNLSTRAEPAQESPYDITDAVSEASPVT